MSVVLSLDNFSLASKGPTVALKLMGGQSVCVLGPAGCGKTQLLRVIVGDDKPAKGEVQKKSVAISGRELSKRTTPLALAKRVAPARKSALAAEALYATELWEVREKPVGELTDSQVAGAELLSCLAADAELLLADAQLDRLDPWTRARVWRMLRSRLSAGCGFVVVTNRPEAISDFDIVVVLHKRTAKFVGSPAELLRQSVGTELRVRSRSAHSVEAITKPLHLKMQREGSELAIQTREGQELAAKLLLEGYGEVEAIGLHEPTPEQAILHLIQQL